jgi:hypothetical protein
MGAGEKQSVRIIVGKWSLGVGVVFLCCSFNARAAKLNAQLTDKEAIREVMAEYCYALDEGRFADLASLFSIDGVYDTALGRANNRAEILAMTKSWTHPAEGKPTKIHLDANFVIVLQGNKAQVTSDWMSVTYSKEGNPEFKAGRYTDEMTKQQGRWLFQRRQIDIQIAPPDAHVPH